MYQNAHEKYLENEVLSAAPQKLRKMLIDGAIRYCRVALNAWQTNDFEAGLKATERVRDIFTELIASTQPTPQNQSIIGVYQFLNREITLASFEHSETRLNDVIRVLEVEQETWHQVCQQLSSGNSAQPAPHYPAQTFPTSAIEISDSQPGPVSWEA